jgi:RNA polymerase sigma-70 factor (sigma-E family)
MMSGDRPAERRAMGRDVADFSEYAAARWGALFRTAYLLTGDHGLAEDLMQTALAKCYVAWPRLRAAEAADAYVRKVLTNTYFSWRRKKSWGREHPTEVLPDRGGDDNTADVSVRQVVMRALEQLPPKQRAVVVLRFYEDLGVEQVAATMACSTGTVKSQTSDALAKLRDLLGDDVELELVGGQRTTGGDR